MNLSESIKFTPSFFKRQAQLTAQRIRQDALQGKFQNDVKGSQLSARYKKYKANRMERFTTRKYKSGMIANKGTKLKAFTGVSIKSTETAFSNMYLTGQTLDSLLVSEAKEDGFTLSFNPRDNKKIIGNERYGRVIADISEPNIELILKDINAHLDEGIEKWCREDVKITVGV